MRLPLRFLALLASSAPAGFGAVLIDESFDHALADGTSLLGQAGSSGNNWALASSTGTFNFAATGLSHDLVLNESGGAVTMHGSSGLPQQGFTLDNTGVRYFALLFRNDATVNYSGGRVLFEAFGSSNEGYGVNFDRITAGTITLYARAGNTNTGSVSISGSETHLIIGRFDPAASTNGTTTIWVNPTNTSDLDSIIATAAATASTAAGGAITRDDGIAFRSTTSTTGAWFTADELRLGTSIGDLGLAVPEPASAAALAGLATVSVVMLRRRRIA